MALVPREKFDITIDVTELLHSYGWLCEAAGLLTSFGTTRVSGRSSSVA